MQKPRINRMSVAYVLLLTVFSMIALTWSLISCDSNPMETEPKPEEELKDYPVYMFGGDLHWTMYTYHPTTGLTDSTDIPWEVESTSAVSADGTRLYLANNSTTVVVSADSLEVFAEIPYEGCIAVSPDNQIVAVVGDGIRILDASDLSLIHYDTTTATRGMFSSNSQRLYCASRGGVVKMDLTDGSYPVTKTEFGWLTEVIPSPDESKWFLNALVNYWASAFLVYDVEKDSIVFSYIHSPGSGDIALSHDGAYAYITSSGDSGTDPPPPWTITIFDVEENQIVRSVNAYDFVQPPYIVPPSLMVITPDGRWLVALGGISLHQFTLYLYDISKGELVQFVDYGIGAMLHYIGVQSDL